MYIYIYIYLCVCVCVCVSVCVCVYLCVRSEKLESDQQENSSYFDSI